MGAFNGSTDQKVFTALVIISTILSTICSAIVIYLIRKMKIWNGHILLIWTMSWFQLLYDVTFFNSIIDVGSNIVFIIATLGQIIGGITSSLASNAIAVISLYVVYNKRSFDIFNHFYFILACILLPSIADSVLYLMAVASDKYSSLGNVALLDYYCNLRLASIGVNFIACGYFAYLVQQMNTGRAVKSEPEIAITTLSQRMIYYPIVQAIGRSACAWYDSVYGYNLDPSDDVPQTQFIAQCFVAILIPAASYGYLAIFLIMQPNAYRCLVSSLTGRPFDDGRDSDASFYDRSTEFGMSQGAKSTDYSADGQDHAVRAHSAHAHGGDDEATNVTSGGKPSVQSYGGAYGYDGDRVRYDSQHSAGNAILNPIRYESREFNDL